jgi:hypothetical protein
MGAHAVARDAAGGVGSDPSKNCTTSAGAVENFRFFDARVQAFADPKAAVAEVKGEGRSKATGRSYAHP